MRFIGHSTKLLFFSSRKFRMIKMKREKKQKTVQEVESVLFSFHNNGNKWNASSRNEFREIKKIRFENACASLYIYKYI